MAAIPAESLNRCAWGDGETTQLIIAWRDKHVMRIFDGKAKNNSAYEIMRKNLLDAGVCRNVTQIQRKIKSLRQEYVKAKDAISKSGASRDAALLVCPNYDVLDEFLGSKAISAPHYMVRSSEFELSETNNGESFEEEEENSTSALFDCTGDSPGVLEDIDVIPRVVIPRTERKRKRKGVGDEEILTWLEKEKKEEQKFQQTLWDKFYESEEKRQKKEDANLEKRLQSDREMSSCMMQMMSSLIEKIQAPQSQVQLHSNTGHQCSNYSIHDRQQYSEHPHSSQLESYDYQAMSFMNL